MANPVVFGLHAVEALLSQRPESILQLSLLEKHRKAQPACVALAQQLGIPLDFVPRERLEKMAEGTNHQGVVAIVKPAPLGDEKTLKTWLAQRVDRGGEPMLLLVLDGIQDPHNFGACLRSAECAGVDAVIFTKDRSAPLTAVARKVASGAAELVPLFQVTNLARTLSHLKEAGVWVYGTALEASTSLYQTDLKGNVAIVMGSEGQGIRELTAKTCDGLIHIPMNGVTQSLNVSVSTGITLFEILRQRGVGSSS